MKLTFDKRLAVGYKSPSQRARVLTERWVYDSIFCPNCGRYDMNQYANNRPVADFFCGNCREDYELKSKQRSIGSKVVDGEHATMLRRLTGGDNPNFFLLSYELSRLEVTNFFVIPKHFFVPEIIEKRRPLSQKAERAEWVGCNILLGHIPQSGKIFFIRNRQIEPKARVLAGWKKTLFLRDEKEIAAKGWLLDVMRCIEKVGKRDFVLDDVYGFERELSGLHLRNRHVKDKIRQQLQILRDKGYLEFCGRGRYRRV